MAFPVVLHGPEGEQLNTYTTQRWPLGTKLVTQDGRAFRFALAGAVALVAGELNQGAANTANHINLTAAAMAQGSRSPTQVLGNTAAAANEYANAYLHITVTPDGGSYYVVGQHDAVAGNGTLTANLAQGYALQNAWTTSTRTNFIHNKFYGLIRVPVTTITQSLAGVSVKAIGIGAYGWVQTAGPCAVLTSGTVILGNPAAYIQVAAAVGPPAAVTDTLVGDVMRVGGTGAWSLINLRLESV